MEYIAHHPMHDIAAYGELVDIPRGATFDTIGGWIATPDGKAICAVNSENAKLHFARNNDGQGLKRGELTYKIAYAPRGNGGVRFTDEERGLLSSKWEKFLRKDVTTILFNQAFFDAEILELMQLDYELGGNA